MQHAAGPGFESDCEPAQSEKAIPPLSEKLGRVAQEVLPEETNPTFPNTRQDPFHLQHLGVEVPGDLDGGPQHVALSPSTKQQVFVNESSYSGHRIRAFSCYDDIAGSIARDVHDGIPNADLNNSMWKYGGLVVALSAAHAESSTEIVSRLPTASRCLLVWSRREAWLRSEGDLYNRMTALAALILPGVFLVSLNAARPPPG
jgi:hypothetical protein